MKILAIESSCDETAAAVITDVDGRPVIQSNIVSSQIELHKGFGGVVPEVAARAHIENILPVIDEALKKAKTKLSEIDCLAITHGPGLIGSLVVGVETVKAISVATGIPMVPVNHLEGHIYASFAGGVSNSEFRVSNRFNTLKKSEILNSKYQIPDTEPGFPILTLLASGGNTLLILMKDHLQYEVLGQTIDDAAGEAFDKGAKLLELGYPGGPIISNRAQRGDASKYKLPVIDLTPKPVRNQQGFMEKADYSLDFSFSGLKTALLLAVKKKGKLTEQDKDDLCASYQKTIVGTLVQNSIRATEKYHPKTFVLAGGVAANKMLREEMAEALDKLKPKVQYLIPDISLCGDNAAMIGVAAYYRVKSEKRKVKSGKEKAQNSNAVTAIPNLKIA